MVVIDGKDYNDVNEYLTDVIIEMQRGIVSMYKSDEEE